MENQLVSIVIPIYNVERYLQTCLDSLLLQTYTRWEALLVDDRSSDNSGNICDAYAARDGRFRVFHIPNGGVSHARNVALNHAKGEWVTFIDGDDYVANNYIETLVQPMVLGENIDLVHTGFIHVDESGTEGIEEKFKPYVGNDMAQFLNVFHGEVFSKLYKRSIIEEVKLRFDTQVKVFEDLLFTFDYMAYATYYALSDATSYYYRQRSDSATVVNHVFYLPERLPSLIHYARSLQTYIELFAINPKAAHYRWSVLSDGVFYSIRGIGFKNASRKNAKAVLALFNHYPLLKNQRQLKRKLYLYAFIVYYRCIKRW